MLPRLVGRSQALEIVMGADDMDADTAAQYGCESSLELLTTCRCCANTVSNGSTQRTGLSRAIPDAHFENFVDSFARRVAGWDHEGIASAKKIINERSGFPTVTEWTEGFTAFSSNFNRAVVQSRVDAFKKVGLQQSVDFEKNMMKELPKYTGPGPWNV